MLSQKRITKRVVDGLKVEPSEYAVWDAQLEPRARFGFIRCDGDKLLQAGNLENLIDRRLKPEDHKTTFGRSSLLCRLQNDPQARRRNKSDFSHVKDDPWISSTEGGADSRFQIWAGQGIESTDDAIHRHSPCHFGSDFQFNSSNHVLLGVSSATKSAVGRNEIRLRRTSKVSLKALEQFCNLASRSYAPELSP
jgi:hypothetical protein